MLNRELDDMVTAFLTTLICCAIALLFAWACGRFS